MTSPSPHKQEVVELTSGYRLARDDSSNDSSLGVPEQWKDEPEESLRSMSGKVVESKLFQQFILMLIVINSLLTATTTFDFVTDDPNTNRIFEIVDTCLLLVFTMELIMNIYYYRSAFFSDGWLVFDFAVVTFSWSFQAFDVLRAFRILRAVRLITHMKGMKDLVTALLRVLPRMSAIFFLLLLIYFVFAVLFTELFKTAYEDGITSDDHFSRLDITAFTLLQFMFLDDWSIVTKELLAVYAWSWIPIISFIIICTFIVVNLIIAVICDAVQSIQTDEMSAQMENMQQLTSKAIKKTTQANHTDMARLEAKMDQILRQNQGE